jgi:acetyl-CoA C-acetyltransferase
VIKSASYAVAAGVYDICLAVGIEKLKHQGIGDVPGLQNVTGNCPAISMPGSFAVLASG